MVNDIENPRSSMLSIGEMLKKTRERKGLTVDQVQKQTRIHSTVINALEEGRCDEILTPTYVKSFLKKYANYLGLDSDELMKEYISSHPEELSENTRLNIGDVKGPDLVSRAIHVISLALLLIALLFLTLFLVKLLVTSVSIRSLREKKEKTAPRSIYIPKTKPTKIPLASAKTKPIEKLKPQSQITPPKKTPMNLTLKVKEPVLVQIKKDGVLLFKRVLPKGLLESFTADNRIELYVAKAEAIELVLNGKPLGSPGKGVIKNLEITSRGIKIR